MKFLRFDNKVAALAAFNPWVIEDQFPAYIGNVAVDVIGTIYEPTGEVISTPEGDIPETAPVSGFHINLSAKVAELSEFEIPAPATPARIFFGVEL